MKWESNGKHGIGTGSGAGSWAGGGAWSGQEGDELVLISERNTLK